MIVDDAPSETDGSVAGTLAALADPRRRRVLRCLRSARQLTLEELAREIARLERIRTEGEDAARRVEVDLYHCQLPRLDGAGLLDYDRERSVVSITDRGGRADAWLQVATE